MVICKSRDRGYRTPHDSGHPTALITIGNEFDEKRTPTKTTVATLLGQVQPSGVNEIVTSVCPTVPTNSSVREAVRNDIVGHACKRFFR